MCSCRLCRVLSSPASGFVAGGESAVGGALYQFTGRVAICSPEVTV